MNTDSDKEKLKIKSALFVIANGAENTGIGTKMHLQGWIFPEEKPEPLDDIEYRNLAIDIIYEKLLSLFSG